MRTPALTKGVDWLAVALNAVVEACFRGERIRAATSADTAALILGVDGVAVAAEVRADMLVGVCERGRG